MPQTQPDNTLKNQPGVSQTPDVKAVAKPADKQGATATPQPMVIPPELQTKIAMKYGGDINKAFEGLSQAEAKMHEATTKVKELERELDTMRGIPGNSPQRPDTVGVGNLHQPSEEERAKLEAYYGIPYEQAIGISRIMNDVNLPLYESMANNKLESLKMVWRKEDPNFTPEVEAKFDQNIQRKHPLDRGVPQIYQECLSKAKGDNLEMIINARVEAKMRELVGNPVPPPSSEKSGGALPLAAVKMSISEDDAVRISNVSGMTMDEVRELYKE